MFQYDFMLNAFAAAGIVSLVSGLIGYFVVLRGQTFAAHALAHVGFAGATGAVLVGLPPLAGLIGLTVLAGGAMGALGEGLERRDVAIGLLLSFSLGLGLLFLHFYTAYAAQLTALLFGNVLGVDRPTILALAATGAVAVALLGAMARPLTFASLQPEVAEARGVPVRAVSVLFLAIVALAVAESAQIVGVLLVFALTVAPAATAQRVTMRLGAGVALSVVFALAFSWLGIALAFYTDWPTTFWIATLGTASYLLTLVSWAPSAVKLDLSVSTVMPGEGRASTTFPARAKTWMAGSGAQFAQRIGVPTSPAMTHSQRKPATRPGGRVGADCPLAHSETEREHP